MTPPKSDGSPPEQPAPARPSVAQILASVLTAVTTTFALSYLGVAGTIIGAGLASTFTVLANYWYTRSILHTQRKVNQLAPKVVRSRPGVRTAALPRVDAASDVERTEVIRAAEPVAVASPPTQPIPVDSDSQGPVDPHALMAPARAGRRRFLVPILAVFVLLLLLITAIELGLGKPLSDALRGQEGSGTSVFHNRVVRDPAAPEPGPTQEPNPTEAPSSEPEETPSEEPTEPQQTSPSQEPTPDPTTPEPSAPEPTEPVDPATPAPPSEPPADQEPGAEGSVAGPDAEVDTGSPDQPSSDESAPAVDARSR